MTNFMRMSTGHVFENVLESEAVFLVCSVLPHLLIDVRQNAASVKDPVLVDEQVEES